ncbi:MAG: rimI: ribosomal-protein-alanine acetyltransferase [Haloplasmataceae bacterium]|jgi:predicted N-acetyltransferase YhbS|nr:rimI: ribosomal-protein-alanine acetyltransferase [Haloplasmataceae bacterium]
MINYEINCEIEPKLISKLRKSVGWNGMELSYSKAIKASYFHVCCFLNNELIGFIDVVSNGITDAYIQDLIVHPNYQKQGIGTNLMNMTINKLKEDNIYMISVLFDQSLLSYYQKFGFNFILAGQLETRYEE